MREQFFNEHVMPHVLHGGFDPHDSRQNFMNSTERPKSSFAEVTAHAAMESALAPFGVLNPEFKEQMHRETQAKAQMLARQGGHEQIAQAVGAMAGQAPYWALGMGLAGAGAEALEAGPMLSKAIDVAAGGIIQGSYDAASAPQGRTLIEGLKGGVSGATMVGATEATKSLWQLFKAGGMSEGLAKAVDELGKGLREPDPELTQAILNHAQPIDQLIANHTAQNIAASKAAGVPVVSASDPTANGKVAIQMTGADGKPYAVGPFSLAEYNYPLDEKTLQSLADRVDDHLKAGGALEGVRGDPRVVSQLLNRIVNGTPTNFDTDVPLKTVSGEPGTITMPMINDVARGTDDDIIKSVLSTTTASANEVREVLKHLRGQSTVTTASVARAIGIPVSYTRDILESLEDEGVVGPRGTDNRRPVLFSSGPKAATDLMGLINARNSVYHATDVDGFKGILEQGKISPGEPGDLLDQEMELGAELAEERGWDPDNLTDSQYDALAAEARRRLVGVSVSRAPRVASKADKAITFVIDADKMPKTRSYVEEGYGKTYMAPEDVHVDPAWLENAQEEWGWSEEAAEEFYVSKVLEHGEPTATGGERNPQFEFEQRTYNEPVPLSAVRGVIVDKEALGYAHPEMTPADQLEYSKLLQEGKTMEASRYMSFPRSLQERLDEIRQLAHDNNIPFKTVESGRELHSYRAGLAKQPPEMRWSTPLYDKLRELPNGQILDELTGATYANIEDAERGISYAEKVASPERVRGDGVPLSTKGHAEVDDLGRNFARKGGLDELIMTNNQRSQQTGTAILAHNPLTRIGEVTDRTASWGNGDLAGAENTPDVQRWKNDLARYYPDHPIGGVDPDSGRPGESFNQVTQRMLPFFKQKMDEWQPGEKLGIVTHFTPVRVIDGWLKKGMPNDFSIDIPTYLRERATTSSVYRLAPNEAGEWKIRKVNMHNDQPLRDGIFLIRHGETVYNRGGQLGEGIPAGESLAGQEISFTGRYKETPLSHRFTGEDIPLLGKGATAVTIGAGEGAKPTIMYARGKVGPEEIFHENLHGHFDNLGVSKWLNQTFSRDGLVWDVYNGVFPPESKKLYAGRDIPEEIFNYAASAVRVGNDDLLDRMGEADTDRPTLLRWTTSTAKQILDRAQEAGDSLHLRTLQRRLNSVVARATGELNDIDRVFSPSDLELHIEHGSYVVEDPADESRTYFPDRRSAINHMEQIYSEPLNAPELVDYSSIPPTPKFATRVAAPSGRAPITSDPPPPDLMPEPYKPGMFSLSFFVRPFYDWLGDVAKRFDRQDLYDRFAAIDKTQVEYNNAMQPMVDVLKKTLGKTTFERQDDFYTWLKATDQQRPFVEQELHMAPEELERLRTFEDQFVHNLDLGGDLSLLGYMRDTQPKLAAAAYDAEKVLPKGKDESIWGQLIHSGQLDPRDTNLLRVSSIYLRKLLHNTFIEPELEHAEDLLKEKAADGRSVWGTLTPLLQRHINYIRGVPDFSQRVIKGAIGATIETINNGIERVNESLPDALQIPQIEKDPGELLNDYIMFSYAGALALRPGVWVRDASQIFITSYPILGNYTFTGMRKAFEAARAGTESDAFKVAERYGAFISRSELRELMEGGGEANESAFGKVEKIVQAALSVQRWAHNSNRLVAFWGHQAKIEDALQNFARTQDKAAFTKASDAWFMRPGMRDKYLKELSLLTPDSYDDFSKRMAKDLVELTQWSYRPGARPGIYDYQLGRLFGQYGTWPLNYIEYARRFLGGVDKVAATQALTRLVLAHGAILSAGQAVGVDTSHWTFTQPMAYGGGPLFQAVANIPNTMDFQTTRGTDARREIKELVWPGIVPGGEEAHTIWEAITTKDPNFWTRLMGFTPLSDKSKNEGWHKLVP